MVDRAITKQLATVEDLELGFGTVAQTRQGTNYTLNRVHAGHIPFSDPEYENYVATNVKTALQEVMAIALVNEADILSISASIDTLLTEQDIPNGSFEIADDLLPTRAADWTVSSIYTGATLALDATDSNHGDKSYKFTSTGSGGAIVYTPLVPCKPNLTYLFSFDIKSSVVDVRNWLRIHWYTDDGSYISETYLYDDATNNPLTWTTKRAFATAPATATQFVLQVAGCASTDPTPGSTWVDGIKFFDTTMALTTKGANIASASTLALPIEGTYHAVTGTSTITLLSTVRTGTLKILEFQAALTLTYHATDLILPGNANIVTQAGDVAIFFEYAPEDWRCISYCKRDGTSVVRASGLPVQTVNVTDGAVATGTTVLPIDDTIPQNTEGDEYMTLSITPTNASNKLLIQVVWNGSTTASGSIAVALFQDTTVNALAAAVDAWDVTGVPIQVQLNHYMTAGTTSPTTFKVRAGRGGAGTTTFNGVGGVRMFGGIMSSSITITEIKV